MNQENPFPSEEEIILLEDLMPRRAIKGGAGKLIFGQSDDFAEDSEFAAEPDDSRMPEAPR